MTTKRQIKKLLQPIAERHQDVILLDYCVVLMPLRHVVRSIWIARCLNADRFRPLCIVAHMFAYSGHASGANSDIFPISEDVHWRHGDPKAADELLTIFESAKLPFLKEMENLDAFLKQTRIPPPSGPSYFGRDRYRNFLREVGAGDFAAALRLYGDGIDMSGWICPRDHPAVQQHYADVQAAIDRLAPLVAAGDRGGVGDVLREMERVTARKMRMEHLWEPTPFPFEADEQAVG